MKNTRNQPVNIPISKLRPFEGHPFKVKDDAEMNTLIESVQTTGILSPLIVRPIENTDEYEVISGHRRLHAAVKAGIIEIPALIYALDRDSAAIAVVDSNLHREHILPSEKAFAYFQPPFVIEHPGRLSGGIDGHIFRALFTVLVGVLSVELREHHIPNAACDHLFCSLIGAPDFESNFADGRIITLVTVFGVECHCLSEQCLFVTAWDGVPGTHRPDIIVYRFFGVVRLKGVEGGTLLGIVVLQGLEQSENVGGLHIHKMPLHSVLLHVSLDLFIDIFFVVMQIPRKIFIVLFGKVSFNIFLRRHLRRCRFQLVAI